MDRCELTDLLVEQCAHCRKPAPVSGPTFLLPSDSGTAHRVRSQYEGRCPICDDRIDLGEIIVRTDDGWVHEDCASQ